MHALFYSLLFYLFQLDSFSIFSSKFKLGAICDLETAVFLLRSWVLEYAAKRRKPIVSNDYL